MAQDVGCLYSRTRIRIQCRRWGIIVSSFLSLPPSLCTSPLSFFLFFLSPSLPPSLPPSAVIEVNQHNLAYLTALFPESEIIREQLCDRRSRLKSFITSCTEGEESLGSYSALLSTQTIGTNKLQILFLLMLVRSP